MSKCKKKTNDWKAIVRCFEFQSRIIHFERKNGHFAVESIGFRILMASRGALLARNLLQSLV